MAWTTPRTWVSGELVTASMMNLHVRDNLNYLYGLALVEWAAYTPVWGNTGTANVLGATTITGSHVSSGTLHPYQIKLSIGAGVTVGDGTMTFTLPATAYSAVDFEPAPVMMYDDSAAAFFPGTAIKVHGQPTLIRVVADATPTDPAGLLSSLFPFPWGTNDRLEINGVLRAA